MNSQIFWRNFHCKIHVKLWNILTTVEWQNLNCSGFTQGDSFHNKMKFRVSILYHRPGFRVPTFPLWQNSMIFQGFFFFFLQISRCNFPFFTWPTHLLIPLSPKWVGTVTWDLLNHGLGKSWEIFPDIKYIGWGLKNATFPQYYSATLKKPNFSMIFFQI